MNYLSVNHPTGEIKENTHLAISGSKSESNRVLVLRALLKGNPLAVYGSSNSEDTQLMEEALESIEKTIDIHHAGTAMRFLSAYFAIQEGRETILTGSSRMKERPIGILVDALKQLGADIEYMEKEGFPPLKIIGKKLTNNKVTLSANVSSQYISALMLIGITFENGLTIQLDGNITSLPYLNMTIEMLKDFDIEVEWKGNTIYIKNRDLKNLQKRKGLILSKNVYIESDWSSASYMYSIVALAKQGDLQLRTFYNNSLQGDKELVNIYEKYFNVGTYFFESQLVGEPPQIKLFRFKRHIAQRIELDLNNCPDIAQTIMVTAVGLKIPYIQLTGLHTLKIKETDRLFAMQQELLKVGAITEINEDSITLIRYQELPQVATIKTYNDHRMAMSFAPLALKGIKLSIENPDVVNKSYPNFWKNLEQLNFDLS